MPGPWSRPERLNTFIVTGSLDPSSEKFRPSFRFCSPVVSANFCPGTAYG